MAHTSVILALFPAERYVRPLRRVARRLPNGGTPAAQMHVTLAYLGDVQALAGHRDHIVDALVRFVRADDTRLINLPVVGLRRMEHVDEGQQAIAADIGGEGVRQFREDLVAALRADGVPVDERWPTFIPHLTLGYVPATALTPPLRVPRITIPAGYLYLCWGDERIVLPLLGTAEKAVTTKPFVSRAQQRYAFATNQPWAEEWAAETDFRKLPARARAKIRREAQRRGAVNVRVKALDDGEGVVWAMLTKAGERIAGQLCRDKRGMYVNCNSAAATQESKDKLKKAEQDQKRAKRDEEKAKERQANIDKGFEASGLNEDAYYSLMDFAEGKGELDGQQELIDAGLVEQAADGSYRMTPTGRRMVNAAERGDTRGVADAVSKGRDTTSARQDRETARQSRAQEREAKRAEREAERKRKQAERDAKQKEPKPKKGGGGGGGAKEPKKSGSGAAPAPARATTAMPKGGGGQQQPKRQGQPGAQRSARPAAPADRAGRDQERAQRDQERERRRQGERAARAEQQRAAAEMRQWQQYNRDVRRREEQGNREAVRAQREQRRLDSLEVRARRGDRLTQGERDRLTEAGRAQETPQGWVLRGKARPLAVVPHGGHTIEGNATLGQAVQHAREHGMVSRQWLAMMLERGLAERRPDGNYALKVRRGHTYWRAFRQERKAGRSPSDARAAAREARRVRDLGRLERRRAKLISWSPATSAFSVFKTRDGRLRWVSFSSNGYLDRDGEHVSVKALAADVSRTDADGRYGPLRWWHEGEPNPLDPERPWGPGVDLGWCDFSAMSGPCLIESGTFTDERIGEAIAAKADQYAISLGFFHPVSEPDSEGVFHHIRRFERSLAPRDRVSNPFTSFVVPTGRAMNTTKKAQLAQLLDTLPPDEVERLIAQGVQRTQTAAKAAGVALKAAAEAPQVYQLPDGSPAIIVEGRVVALKAMPMADEKADAPAAMAAGMAADAAADAEALAEEAEVEAEEPADDTAYAADMPVEEFRAMIREEVAAALKPIVSQMKMGEKMEGMLKMMGEEMKGYMSGVGQKAADGEATVAELRTELAALKAELTALKGDTPRAIARASRAAATVAAEVQAPEESQVTTKSGQPAYSSSFDQIGGWLEGAPAAD